MTEDFKALQYYSSVNQFICTGTSNHNADNYGSTWMAYRPTHQTECCAGQIHRMMPNYAARMWLRSTDGVVAALYGPSSFKYSEALAFVEETSYPYDETVAFRVEASAPERLTLTLRIPGWCKGARVKVNGKAVRGDAAGLRKAEAEFEQTPDGPRLRVPVVPVEWQLFKSPEGKLMTPPLPEHAAAVGDGCTIKLIPYGQTELRLTVFPMVE